MLNWNQFQKDASALLFGTEDTQQQPSNDATTNPTNVDQQQPAESTEKMPEQDESKYYEMISKAEDAEVHLVILVAGMGGRKDHYLGKSFLLPFGKWFDINQCQKAMKGQISDVFNYYAKDEVKKRSPHILVKSIDYCTVVREEGGYNEKLNMVSMKTGVQLLRTIANESMTDVLMYNSEKIKKQMQAVCKNKFKL